MAKKTKKQAFTIVELVIVIAVIAILAAILIPTYSNLVKKANEATALVDAKNAITEMLANILGGNDEPADIVVMNKKAGKVYIHGYDASKGMILTYVENPEEPGSGDTFFDQAKAIRTKLITNGYLENVEITDTTSWRHMDVLNGEGGTVEKLGFDRESMVVFADCIITDKFAKKSSGGDEPVHTHSWASKWSNDANYHWHNCTAAGCNVTDNSEKQGYAAHTPGDPATEDSAQVCTECGYVINPPTGHICKNHLTHHAEVPATCTAEGTKEYWECSGCGKYFSDANGETETTPEAMTIPANGHTEVTDPEVAATCTEAGKTAGKHCSVCNAVLEEQQNISAKGHTYTLIDNKDGSTHTKKCSVCGDIASSKEAHIFENDGKCKCGAEAPEADLTKKFYLYSSGSFTFDESTGKLTIKDGAKPRETQDTLQTIIDNSNDGELILIKYGPSTYSDGIGKTHIISEPLKFSRKTVYFDLNGYTIKSEYNPPAWPRLDYCIASIDTNSNVTLLDSSAEKSGTLMRAKAVAALPVVYVSGSTLNIYGGTITAEAGSTCGENDNANGISTKSNATINMYGGKICNNATSDNGGGIILNYNCTFNMYGGEISGNVSAARYRTDRGGGGVCICYGTTFNMYGGKIHDNYVAKKMTTEAETKNYSGYLGQNYNGGGVRVMSGGTFNFNAGEISNNYADLGSAVFIESGGNYTVSEGVTISGNFSWSDKDNQVCNKN